MKKLSIILVVMLLSFPFVVASFQLSLGELAIPITSFDPSLPCAQQDNFEELVFGATPNSDLGVGAVDLCNRCHYCGQADGVCPEDFTSTATGPASCSYAPDPDCTGSLQVDVETQTGNNKNGFETTILYQGGTQAEVVLGETNIDGELLSENDVVSGVVQVRITKQGWQTQQQTVELLRGELVQINFTDVQEAECLSDCTRGEGICDPTCNGVNGCEFATQIDPFYNITQACAYESNNSLERLGKFEGEVYFAQCCAGDVFSRVRPEIDISGQTGIIDLITNVQTARMNGESLQIVIASYSSS